MYIIDEFLSLKIFEYSNLGFLILLNWSNPVSCKFKIDHYYSNQVVSSEILYSNSPIHQVGFSQMLLFLENQVKN